MLKQYLTILVAVTLFAIPALAGQRVTVLATGDTRANFQRLGLTVDKYQESALETMDVASAAQLAQSLSDSRLVIFGNQFSTKAYKAVFSSSKVSQALQGVLKRGGIVYFGTTSWSKLNHWPKSLRSFFKRVDAFLPGTKNYSSDKNHSYFKAWANPRLNGLALLHKPNDLSKAHWKHGAKAGRYWHGYPASVKALLVNPKLGHTVALLENNVAGQGKIIFCLSYSVTRMARSPFMENLATAAFKGAQEKQSSGAKNLPVVPGSVLYLKSIPTAPVSLDGRLGEPFWKGAVSGKLSLYQSGTKPKKATKVRAVIAGNQLVVGFQCQEPNMAGLHTKVTKRDGAVWKDDSVEIMIAGTQANGKAGPVYHWILSADGALYDSKSGNAAWNSKARVAVTKEAEAWSAEITIPLSDIFKNGKAPNVFRINFGREEQQLGEISSWITPIHSFNSPKALGYATTLTKQQFANWQQAQSKRATGSRTGWMIWSQSPWITAAGPLTMPKKDQQPVKNISMTAPQRGHGDKVVMITNFDKAPLTLKMARPTTIKTDDGGSVPFSKLFTLYRAVPRLNSYQRMVFDPLLKMNALSIITIPSGRTAMIWVDSHGAIAPSTYTSKLTLTPISTMKVNVRQVKLKLTIADVTLPDPLPVQVYTWGPYNYSKAKDHIEAYWKMASAFHINNLLCSYPFGATVKQGPTLSTNPKDYLGNIQTLMEYGRPVFSYELFNQFDRALRRNGFKGKQFDDQWQRLFATWMQRWQNALNGAGITPDQYVVQIADEPHPGKETQLLAKEVTWLNKHYPKLDTMLDMAQWGTQKQLQIFKPYINLWVPNGPRVTRADSAKKELAFYQKQGNFWTYLCSTRMDVQSLLSYYRYRGIRDWSLGASGIGLWAFNSWGGDPWAAWDGIPGRKKIKHDECLVYSTPTGPTPSIRLMAFRQGIGDYVLLKMLQKQNSAPTPSALVAKVKPALDPLPVLTKSKPASIMQWRRAVLKALAP